MRPPCSFDFWDQVDRRTQTECWEWLNNRNQAGYGQAYCQHGYEPAHRIAWEVTNGRPIPRGKVVRHHCDNPPCCNPAHLALGRHWDNSIDMIKRGRTRSGLTGKLPQAHDAQVLQWRRWECICRLMAQGKTDLASRIRKRAGL